jgi:hypothetical protein
MLDELVIATWFEGLYQQRSALLQGVVCRRSAAPHSGS